MESAMDPTECLSDETGSEVLVSPPESASGKNEEKPVESKTDASTETKDAEEAKILIGAVPECKDMYAKYDEHGNRSWSEALPDGLEEAAENEQTLKYALLVRKKKPKEAESSRPLVIDSIIIQSPFLKRVLASVLDGYPGIVTNVSRLTLSAPFECFVHRWDRFAAAKDDPEYDETTKQHIRLLHDLMKQELGDIIQLREDYFNNRAVTWEHVWTLFPPGSTVLGSKNGRPVAVHFNLGYYAQTQCGNVYALDCECIDWDGTVMGWSDANQQIPEYVGARPFTDLPCYPLAYHAQPEAIRAMLIARGRKFLSLAGYHYKAYEGPAIYHPEANKTKDVVEMVSCRVVIDGANWEKCNPDNIVYGDNLHKYDNPIQAGARRGSNASNDSEAGDESIPSILDKRDGPPILTEDQLLMTTPLVRGYSLKNKRWMKFFVDNITEVVFDDKAFESLVLQDDQKELILALAQSQVKYKHAFDDVISGKGKGIIMLLSGGPGIGKTLTAESVAEEMRAPLYIISAGDLGIDAGEVEENLSRILAMVANWDAVLLLDECDVFLEQRSTHDMERNRIVGIFLRMLEYFEGCLFLCTNRVKNMDPAFQSRIHMSLEYPPLDVESRATIWRTFLGRTIRQSAQVEGEAAHEMTEEHIAELSKLDLNGRQIKNVLKLSNLLACQKEQKLGFEQIRKVLKVQGRSL